MIAAHKFLILIKHWRLQFSSRNACGKFIESVTVYWKLTAFDCIHRNNTINAAHIGSGQHTYSCRCSVYKRKSKLITQSLHNSRCNRMKYSQFACEISATIASAVNAPWNATKTKRRHRNTELQSISRNFSPNCIRVYLYVSTLHTLWLRGRAQYYTFFQLKFGKMSACVCAFNSNLHSLKCGLCLFDPW